MATPCGWVLPDWWHLCWERWRGRISPQASLGWAPLPDPETLKQEERGLDGCCPCIWAERSSLECLVGILFLIRGKHSYWVWSQGFDFFYILLCESLWTSAFYFKYLIHVELILIYDVRKQSSFIIFHGSVQFAQHNLLKRLSLFHCVFLPSLS